MQPAVTPPIAAFIGGFALALMVILALRVLRKRLGRGAQVWAMGAVVLAVAVIYPIRAHLVASDESALMHALAAGGFALLTLLGAALSPVLLGLTLLLHAGFDFALDISLTSRGLVAHWYPPFCLAFDATLGLWWLGAIFKDRRK